jgi:acyl-[acyl-carrier-protein]-phospholipid O-acyltransferase/long-chain-fatty-acid--[acyl-carrier-protein] ligase
VLFRSVYDSNSTLIFGTNSFLKGYARKADPYDFRSVRYVFAGAEAIQDETRDLFFDKFGLRILAGYGATETSPVLTLNTPMHFRGGSVGRFLPNIEWKLETIPGLERGGRLQVKGPNVMLGYLLYDRPGVIDPPEGGWYDTGDIVDVDAEGYVWILGRAKRFAKIAGEMVSLSAAEMLASAASPDHAHAVVSLPDQRKGEKLILVTDDRELDRQAVRDVARQKGISDLVVPAEIIVVDEIPLLGSGKVDYTTTQKLVEDRQNTSEPT